MGDGSWRRGGIADLMWTDVEKPIIMYINIKESDMGEEMVRKYQIE